MTRDHDPFPPGTEVGPYRIEARVGEGGMGVVYRARDAKLNRVVAIKFLSEDLADSAARRRFQREAQMASALNHPHILTVHDIGELEGRQYLVTEFADAGTLTEWARATRRSWRQIIELLIGVADALAEAHGAAMLHRDIKPDNVLVTKNGYAKLADFGLAKLDEGLGSTAQGTLTTTRSGVIVGTVAYMSPEQASSKPLDARSDIFSFGLLLYELLDGQRPFKGDTPLDVLQAIVHQPTPRLEPTIPLPLRLVVEKALEKDPADRYQTMREMVIDLRRLLRQSSGEFETRGTAAAASAQFASRQLSIGWIAAPIIAFSAAAAALIWIVESARGEDPSPRVVQVQRLTDMVGLEEAPALSPDGRTVAFVAASKGRRHIWVRLLAGGSPLQLTHDDADHVAPRWSPDSSSVLYFAPASDPGESGTIWEVPALGGPPRRLASALAPGDVSHDGRSLALLRFREGDVELLRVGRDQTEERVIAKVPPGAFKNLRWSPDDRQLAYLVELGGASFSTSLMVVDAAGGEPRTAKNDFQLQGAAWLPDGSALVVSSNQGSLMSYPPQYNLWQVRLDGGPSPQLTFGEFSYESPDVGTDGRLVASRVRTQSDVWRFPVTGDPASNARMGARITRQTGMLQTLTLAPDEREVAFLSDNGGHANVWTARVDTGEMRPVTRETDPRVLVAVPVWSPRGDWINYLSNRRSTTADVTLWLARPDGSEARDLGINGVWACWSPDGAWLYYSEPRGSAYRIRKVPVDGGDPVTVREDNAIGCSVARDNRALYYASPLTQTTGAMNFEIRVAEPESGPSRVIGRVTGARVPAESINFHAFPSPDGSLLAMPLIDGSTTNLWGLSTRTGEWRQLTDFADRNVVIARRIAWSGDGTSLYASVSDVDSDVVILSGLVR